jgi:hypothetical protein
VREPVGIPRNWRLLHAFSQVGGRASMMTKPAGKGGGRNRLGVAGEYQPQRLSLDRHDARRRFFQILAREQPEIFIDLRAAYQTVQHKPELWHYPNVPDGLRKWGKRWHLRDPWCLDLAREAFAEWDAERKGEKLTVGAKTHPLESAALGISANPGIVLGTWKGNFDADGYAIPGGAFIGVGALSVSVPGWLVFNEAESAFRERAVQQFKQELEGYIERARAAAKDHGAVPTIVKGTEFEEHLTWLARAAVKGERPADIWKSLPVGTIRGRRAVEKAIRETAKLIGLTLHET